MDRSDGGAPPAPARSRPQEDGRGLTEEDLKPSPLRFSVPYRSILTLRSEEDYLKAKLYEDWRQDSHIESLPDHTAPSKKDEEFQIVGHERNLLDLTVRHLRRVGYCCLADVRRTVYPMPAPHESGSGFDRQWKNLSEAYRRLIYVEALAKTHPSRFYQTVPVCDTCQFMYSMADKNREHLVLQGSGAKNSGAKKFAKRETTNGIEEARQRGKERRARAEDGAKESAYSPGKIPIHNHYNSGSESQADDSINPYPQDSMEWYDEENRRRNSFQNEEYDRLFDSTYVEKEGDVNENGMECGANGSNMVDRLKSQTAGARDGPIQIGISTEGGAISSWVRMLSEPGEGPVPLSRNNSSGSGSDGNTGGSEKQRRAQSAGVRRLKETSAAATSKADENGKPNPMGPLAGQGIGGPKGQYRGFSAPVGYMLGQTSGKVGSKFIDDKGNFLQPKRRSPAERGTSPAENGEQSTDVDSEQQQDFQAIRDERFQSGEGIAFSGSTSKNNQRATKEQATKKSVRPKSGVPSSRNKTSNAISSAEYEVGHPNRSSVEGKRKKQSERPKSAAVQRNIWSGSSSNQVSAENVLRSIHGDLNSFPTDNNLLDIGTYSFKSFRQHAQPQTGGEAKTTDAMASLYASSGMDDKTNVPNVAEYRFDLNNTPGSGNAPFLPLTPGGTHAQTRSSDRTIIHHKIPNDEATRNNFENYVPSQLLYESGGTKFEDMISSSLDEPMRRNETVRKTNEKVNKLLAKDRIANTQELRRIAQEKEDQEREEIGYLGGLKITDKIDSQNNIYGNVGPKLVDRKSNRKSRI